MKTISKFNKLSLTLSLLLTSASSFAADKVTFQLDWLPGGDKAPVYVGVQQGFFAEQDLDVTILGGKGSTDAITKIATGTADIGSADIVALLVAKANDNVPVKAIYSLFSKAPYAFYVLDDSGINSVKDVSGKTIATSPFTSANVFLPLMLKKNGIEEESVKVLKADPGALNPMLITGQSDVMISWMTDRVKNEQQAAEAGKKLTVLPWYDAGLEFYSSSIIASDKFMSENPDVVKRFVKAYAKAVEYTWAHPEESGADVTKMVPEVDSKQAADTIKSIHGLVMNEVSQRDGVGQFTPSRLSETWKWTAEAQGLDLSKLDPETAVDRQFYEGVN
ncbi:ABC transporter substrate-binding protein [Vibrio plantisponsor]|uniref:ABC transporter substrate-binding protein n=1 Tax=Vibrio plantisponsor TaxID=664643 RepID=A0ABU4ICF5_9VIBR|nr:ABC transporter substrate-binding protein [Vibrio plantisponsor]MDW6016233.1 ABC transporter substrate-binding protein [Vibrio plantisponsor]NNM41135.1 ABC transporter substrate-binding protein [Vibrio plantisponsor]